MVVQRRSWAALIAHVVWATDRRAHYLPPELDEWQCSFAFRFGVALHDSERTLAAAPRETPPDAAPGLA